MVLHEASANAGDGTSPNTCALATLKKTPGCTQHCLYVYVIYIYIHVYSPNWCRICVGNIQHKFWVFLGFRGCYLCKVKFSHGTRSLMRITEVVHLAKIKWYCFPLNNYVEGRLDSWSRWIALMMSVLQFSIFWLKYWLGIEARMLRQRPGLYSHCWTN